MNYADFSLHFRRSESGRFFIFLAVLRAYPPPRRRPAYPPPVPALPQCPAETRGQPPPLAFHLARVNPPALPLQPKNERALHPLPLPHLAAPPAQAPRPLSVYPVCTAAHSYPLPLLPGVSVRPFPCLAGSLYYPAAGCTPHLHGALPRLFSAPCFSPLCRLSYHKTAVHVNW